MLLALLPALVCLWLVDEYAGNTPMWDEWERGPLLQKFAAGDLGWSDLTAAHINHRILTQRLLVLAGTELWPGDLRTEQFCIVALLIIAGLGLAWLVHRSGAARWAQCLALFSMSMLLFSPLQFQNLLWAIQFAFVFPIPMLVLAAILLVPTSRHSLQTADFSRHEGTFPKTWWLRVVLAAMACWLATYSFGHGLLTWIVMLPLVTLVAADARWTGWRRGLAWGGGWALLSAAVWWRYFTNLVNTSHPAHAYFTPTGEKAPGVMSLSEFMEQPWDVLQTAVTMLGAPLARLPGFDPRDVGLWLGLFLLLTALVLTISWCLASQARKLRALPFLALLAFGCGAVLAVSVSRTTVIDVTWVAVKSRYVTLATMAWIGSIGMILSLCGKAGASSHNNPAAEHSTRWLPVSAACAGILLAHSAHQWMVGSRLMEHWRNTRLQAMSALMHLDFTEIRDIHRIDADADFIRRQANFLIDRGWLKAHIFDELKTTNFDRQSDLHPKRGKWLVARIDDEDNLELKGFASLPEFDSPAHGIYLVWQPDGVSWEQAEVLGYASVHGVPPVVLNKSDYEYSGALMPESGMDCHWSATVPVASLGQEPGELVAMAINVNQMISRCVSERIRINPSDLTPGTSLLKGMESGRSPVDRGGR